MPTPSSAIALTGAADGAHLFGPHVKFDSTATYTVEAYVNAANLTSGAVLREDDDELCAPQIAPPTLGV